MTVRPSHCRAVALAVSVPIALFVVLSITLGTAPTAAAHGRSMSYSTWKLDAAGARVELRLKEIELTREAPGHAFGESLPAELTLEAGGVPCVGVEATRARTAPEGWAIYRWRVRCEASDGRVIRSQLFRTTASGHTHFLRVEAPEGSDRRLHEHILVTGRDEGVELDARAGLGPDARAANAQSDIASFVRLGGEHIASGWDHLAFVLALLLLAGSLREVALLVTSFTAAHSLTLGLAVLGLVRPEPLAAEVLIAFSIALVAAENGWLLGGRGRAIPTLSVATLLAIGAAAVLGRVALGPLFWLGLALFSACHFGLLQHSPRPARLRTALAFAFGLLHGFGFAGVLMEMALPTDGIVRALLGFNVGVELGQLAVVGLAWPLLSTLRRANPSASRWVAELGSATILGLGLFWLAVRAF